MLRYFWNTLLTQVFAPKANEKTVEAELVQGRRRVKPPVLWLLGKTQSGKSSIIQGLTGSSKVEIGAGFRPCTRASATYDYPNEEESLLRFLDTRGIGEPSYDPTEDLAYAEKHADGLLVVMRARDPDQSSVKQIVAMVRKRNRSWPVLLVSTTLHQAYSPDGEHPTPYCFDQSPLPAAAPRDLARLLEHQREEFAGLFDKHVAIDFTQPDDGYEPQLYGKDALWAAIEAINDETTGLAAVLAGRCELPSGLRDALFTTAHPHIISYSAMAGLAAVPPAPIWNVPGVFITQAKMLHSIASIYGQPLTGAVEAIGPAIGTGFLIRTAGRSLLSGLPIAGSAAAALFTASATYGLGVTVCWYFAEIKRGFKPDSAHLRRIYDAQKLAGRERFREYFQWRRKPSRKELHTRQDDGDAT